MQTQEQITQQQLNHLYAATHTLMESFTTLLQEPPPIPSSPPSNSFEQVLPKEQMATLTSEFQQQLAQTSLENKQLVSQLEQQLKERDEMETIMQDCFKKMERLEARLALKRKG